jgi:hypothetical protein
MSLQAPLEAGLDLSEYGWALKLQSDADLVERVVPRTLHALHTRVVDRSRRAGARALILSGSTASRKRTEISDLDYHLIGEKSETRDLSMELECGARYDWLPHAASGLTYPAS